MRPKESIDDVITLRNGLSVTLMTNPANTGYNDYKALGKTSDGRIITLMYYSYWVEYVGTPIGSYQTLGSTPVPHIFKYLTAKEDEQKTDY